jgi:hypothetical protein
MNLLELREQLQEDMISYFHTIHNYEPELLDNVCQVIVDTFDNAFYAPAPITLDSAPQN